MTPKIYAPQRLARFIHVILDVLSDVKEKNFHIANDWGVKDSAITHDKRFAREVLKLLEDKYLLLYQALLAAAAIYTLSYQGKSFTITILEDSEDEQSMEEISVSDRLPDVTD